MTDANQQRQQRCFNEAVWFIETQHYVSHFIKAGFLFQEVNAPFKLRLCLNVHIRLTRWKDRKPTSNVRQRVSLWLTGMSAKWNEMCWASLWLNINHKLLLQESSCLKTLVSCDVLFLYLRERLLEWWVGRWTNEIKGHQQVLFLISPSLSLL